MTKEGYLTNHSNKEIERILKIPITSNTEPFEDRLILQEDGSRACITWELSGKGYHLHENEQQEKIDEKLIKDYPILKKYLKNN